MGMNSFNLIGDTDIDDPLQIALMQLEISSKKSVSDVAPEAPVKEVKKGALAVPHDGGRAHPGHGQGVRGRGPRRNYQSGSDVNRLSKISEGNPEDLSGKPSNRGRSFFSGSRQPYRGHVGRGGGYVNENNEEKSGRPGRRQFERQSGISYPHENVKGEPVPPVNLGTAVMLPEQKSEENVNSEDKSLIPEEPVELDNAPSSNANNKDKESVANGREEKEPEVEVMTLEEYEKVLEEKRRTLVAMKTEERKVNVDKEFEYMQRLSVKKLNHEVFIKLGSDKEAEKRKEDTDRDERIKKSVSINEFLKPADGERYYAPGVRRGRGRGGGDHGHGQPRSFRGVANSTSFSAPSIEDRGQFPTLGEKSA